MERLDALPPTLNYRPNGMNMWDTWCIEHQEKIHLFHLQTLAHETKRPREDANWLGHAVSADGIHWEEQPQAFGPNTPGTRDDLQPWTGCVYENAGKFYLYYTMRSSIDGSQGQHMGLATSTDLMHWERYAGNPVISPDPKWYISHDESLPPTTLDPAKPEQKVGVVDCRDLVIVRDPAGKGFWGFYAARIWAEESAEQSVIACVHSDDLLHWTHRPPIFAPRKYNCIEVPDVYQINGRWYLTCLTGNHYGSRGIYSDPNVTKGTIYATSARLEGPYKEIDGDNVILGSTGPSAGYSLRSVMVAGERLAFYTEQHPEDQTATISPPMRLRATTDGRLRLAYSPRVQGWRKGQLLSPDSPLSIASHPVNHPQWSGKNGRWMLDGKIYLGMSHSNYQIADLGIGAENMEIEATVKLLDGTGAGLVLRHGAEPHWVLHDFVFALDAGEQRVYAARAQEFEEVYARAFLVERGRAYHIRICARGPRVEFFIDDDLYIQFTMRKPYPVKRTIGLFVDHGRAEISKLSAWEL